MSWLSENERRIEGKLDMFDLATKEMPRMARVIRELAKFLPAFRDIQSSNPAVDLEILFDAYKNLSPDAKEVIDDSTAPRST